jgi:3-dehydroquinate dehydratase I
MATVQRLVSMPTPTPPAVSRTLPVAATEALTTSNDERRQDGVPLPDTGSVRGMSPRKGDTRIVAIVHGREQGDIAAVFAEVLGKPLRTRSRFGDITAADEGTVVSIAANSATSDIASRSRDMVVAVNAHCVELGMPPDVYLSAQCDFEFLYTKAPFFRRDVARFIAHVLGQIDCHAILMAKPRTYIISTTFPDVRAALPNLDILTVGADAVELRVDLLREPLGDGSFAAVPSLSYVGEQVMLLRQRTELPLIVTTRCTRENGRFPMDRPGLFYEYQRRAIQWGVEYVDVELWLPEHQRQRLYQERGNSRIMCAYHDFSGTFKWPSAQAESIFLEAGRYADIIKMIATIQDENGNFELEYFRSRMRSEYPNGPPLSAVNMGEIGQISRTLNKVFSPITHPLLPTIAAPGQMSAAEINSALSLLGQLPKKNIYGISGPSSRSVGPQAPFYEKCFNELGLPYHFAVMERQATRSGGIEAWCNQRNFGGAYLDPPTSFTDLSSDGGTFFTSHSHDEGMVQLTEAARVIGMVDTILVRPNSATPLATTGSSSSTARSPTLRAHQRTDSRSSLFGSIPSSGSALPPNTTLVLDNASWRGILSTLTRDMAPSAYFGRAAVVLASSGDDASSALFALQALQVSKIYTVGFRTPTSLANELPIEPFNSLESLQKARMLGADGATTNAPFVVVSALGADKSNLVGMMVRLFASWDSAESSPRRVFLDLAGSSSPRRPDPAGVAEKNGFAAYGLADVAAFTTVETLRLLVGQNVPYSFVRLASGRSLY